MTFDVAKALLQTPDSRRKKRYAMMLFSSKNADPKEIRTIEKAVQVGLPEHTLIRIEEPDEGLKVMMVKNVEYVILDSSFFNDDLLAVEFAVEAKKRKKCPMFFVSKNDGLLIQEYRRLMYMYEELDDYVLSPIDFVELSKKLKRASMIESRAAKRFTIGQSVGIDRLDTSEQLRGTLTDISLVGFGMVVGQEAIMSRLEQVRVQIQISTFGIFHPHYGEFLRLAGKVRRISIDGKKIGCSLEFVTPMQSDCLARVLEHVSRKMRQTRLANDHMRKNVRPQAG